MSSRKSDLKAELSAAALRLRNANPEGFDQFVNLLNDLAMTTLVQLSDAPSERVLLVQGQTQQQRWFLRLLQECDKEPKTTPTP